MAQQKAIEAPAEELEDLVDELQPGTKLLKGQYTITRYLNSGGFGITYLAKDSLDRDVVIKECFPSSFCRRSKTVVAARSRAHTAELRSVVQLFVREARSLAKIVHPNIVAVHQVFEDNGTAYMAIDYVDGLDLQQIIDGQSQVPGAEQIVEIADKLLHAIGFIHANDMLHRDISPDNILIDRSGEPILIDFGAAREQASQKSRAMSALRVVKDGYSPQEFYIAGSEQGPWSDLYALGATLYHLITGEAPVNGQARLAALAEDRADPYLPLEGRFEGYPPGFLASVDLALRTLPKQRVQSAAEWLMLFRGDSGNLIAPKAPSATQDPIAAAVQQMVQSDRGDTRPNTATTPTPSAQPEALRRQSAPRPQPSPAPAAKSGVSFVQIAAGIFVALALVGGGMVLLGSGQDAPSATTVATVAAAPSEPAPSEPAPSESAPSAPVETAAASGAPPSLADPAPAEPEAVAAAPEPEPAPEVAPEPVVAALAPIEPDPAPVETVAPSAAEASPAPAAGQPTATGSVRSSQVTFAAWDVEMPFSEGDRLVGNRRVGVVQAIPPRVDLEEAGRWLAPGVLIFSVNGIDVQQSGSVATAVLNALNVDPDGRARVVVQYRNSSPEMQTGLLTVKAKRIVTLANGVTLTTSNVDGQWRTVVDGVTRPAITELRQGDVLFRDKTTGTALDGAQSLEKILSTLVAQGTIETEFSIIRDNKTGSAAMQLATE